MPHAITLLSIAAFAVSAVLALVGMATMFAGALVVARAEQAYPPA
jgi:hypothetical protein